MGPQGSAETIVGVSVDDADAISFEAQNPVLNYDAETIESAFAGDWCAESKVPADLLDTCLLVSKIKGLGVPPLAVKLGDAYEKPLAPTGDPQSSSADGKPKIKSLIVTSATSATANGHTAPVMRLAVSIDQRFFVSGSYDGTCRVWELDSIEESAGLIESAAVYSDHFLDGRAKVNDIAMLEGTHSVVSGDSHGNVHVWRVDLASPSVPSPRLLDRPRIAGSNTLKRLNRNEGEVIAVSHFNTASSCVATYATQRGGVRSWDLRAAREPFSLRHSPELGLLTSIALGSDRHWIVTGTRCGYVALWDLRYERCVKLWRHSRRAPIARLATSMVPPPQTWGSAPSSMDQARPSIFAATGHNECAMFDVLTGSCKECFRTIDGDNGQLGSSAEEPPKLLEVAIASNSRNGVLTTSSIPLEEFFVSSKISINCMLGSIGAGHNSYLITGGSDSRIRFWDFTTPSKCYVICGQSSVQPRPTFERVDFDGQRRLMLCRQSHATGSVHQHFHGMRKPDHQHTDSIQDIKIVNSTLISCSRDCTVKIWR
jgi:phosphoinositide-3-kinase, regulatory subunit 4